MKCYHGTTPEFMRQILSGEKKSECTWYCSDDDCLYVYPLNKADEYDDEWPEDSENAQVICALESAQLTAACHGHSKILVMEFDFPDEELEDDGSCDNMEDVASCVCISDYSRYLTSIHYSDDYNPELRPFYLMGMKGNYQFNRDSLSSDMQDALSAIEGQDIFLDLFPCDFRTERYNNGSN